MAATAEKPKTQGQEDELARARALAQGKGEGGESADDKAAIAAANSTPDSESAGGKSIDDMTDADTPTPPMQIPIPGTTDTISSVVGGAKPTVTEVRLLGGSLPVVGEFKKGDEITLIVTAKVGAVEFVDSQDEWGTTTKSIRRHKLRMTSVKRAAATTD